MLLHAKEKAFSIASHMQSAHLIVIQTFLCKPKSSLLNLLHVSKQFFKYKSLYKLTKLGLNNEQQRIESIFSTTSLTEVEKLSHLIGFLYVDGQEVHLSKWERTLLVNTRDRIIFHLLRFSIEIHLEILAVADLLLLVKKFSRCF